LTYFSTFSGQY